MAVRLAGLACLALLAEPATGLADTAAAGRLGVGAQASLALGAGLVTTATWLVSPILFAQTTQIARLRAAGRNEEADRTVRSALVAAAVLGLALAAGLAMFAVLGMGPDARGYVVARAVGLPVTAVVLAGYGALRGAGAMRDVTAIALLGAGLHVLLDVVVVTRTGLGVTGIGLASVLSQGVVVIIVLRQLKVRGLWVAGSRSGGGEWRGSAAAVGILATRSALLGGAALAMTAAAVGVSPTAGAAHLVTYQFWLLAVLAVEGWKSAAQIMVSSAHSLAEQISIESALMRGSLVLGAAAGLAVLAALPVATDVLAASAEVAGLAGSIWWLSALSLVAGAVAFTRDGIEYGHGAFGRNLLRIAAGTVIWLVGAWGTHLTGDLRYMWAAMPLGLLVRAIGPQVTGRGAAGREGKRSQREWD